MVNNSIKRSNSKLSFEAKFSFEQGDIKIQNQEKNLELICQQVGGKTHDKNKKA